MKKIIFTIFFSLITFNVYPDVFHYKKFESFKFEIFRNKDLIGFNNYFFKVKGDFFNVRNEIEFKVNLLGKDIFKVSGKGNEKYLKNQLISFNSQTLQNKKNKYVKLNYNENKDEFVINGSSFKGTSSSDIIVGNWWNYEILKSKKQISPISGSIKEQIVSYIGKEKIELYGKKYMVDHFKIQSKDPNTPKNKKLDFDIWLDEKTLIILKVAYSRLGNWEYKLKEFK